MKGFAVAVAALCAASVSARIVILDISTAFHTDEWCAAHHLGEGPSTCIQNSGCCYDGRIGICHSCDAHSDEWCGTYGGTEVKQCIGYAGCTFDYEIQEGGLCVTNSDPSAIQDEITCEEGLQAALEADPPLPPPQCTDEGEWAAEQMDADTGQLWCVDENGHEIPDTRMSQNAFATNNISCDKERKQHAGMQCPNAVTLSTGNGEVMINDDADVGNCDITCNTDKDCKVADGEWCCYNGCGYACRVPIFPKADCSHLSLDASLQATDLSIIHGTEVTIACAEGYFGDDAVEIECKHGSWSEYTLKCMKDCDPYRIIDGRERDYEIKGNGLHHENKRKVSCINGYGAVAGSPDAMRFYKETVSCLNGAWEERSLQCSSCFDAPSEGPHAWWTGIEDGSERGDSFDCLYFASRPTQCAQFPSAGENCRISCRTCDAALLKYKIKAVLDTKADTNHPEKWLKKKLKLLVGFQNLVTDQRRVKVAKRVKKPEGR